MKWIIAFMALAIIVNSTKTFSADFDLCKKSYDDVTHIPDADVNHGVDSQIVLKDPVIIPVTVDLAKRYNLPSNGNGVELNAPIGLMEIYKDGRILYDGKDISGTVEDRCSEFKAMINTLN